jgi:hypothetical protein
MPPINQKLKTRRSLEDLAKAVFRPGWTFVKAYRYKNRKTWPSLEPQRNISYKQAAMFETVKALNYVMVSHAAYEFLNMYDLQPFF